MARGQANKRLTTRRTAAAGTRGLKKSSNSLTNLRHHNSENIDPNGAAGPPTHAEPVNEYPKPRPRGQKANKSDVGEEEAARALVSLHNFGNSVPVRTSSPAPGPPTSEDTASNGGDIYGSGEEGDDKGRAVTEDEEEDEEELEIDQLDASSDMVSLASSRENSPAPRIPFFSVPIVVPYRNASRDVDGISSSTKFSRVIRLIAERMGVAMTLLGGIGYIPSYKPKNSKPVPKLLEDELSWAKLLEDIHTFRLACKGKNGKGSIKPFYITIVDTTGHTGKAADSKLKKKKAAAAEPPTPALTAKETAHISALKTLENRHMCQQHRKPCLIQTDGEHYHLTMNDITKWAYLMAENKALLDTPPPELNITDFTPRQHLAKKAIAAPAQANSSAFPDWMEKLVGMMFVGNVATANRVASMSVNPLYSPAPPSVPAIAPVPVSTTKRAASPFDYPDIDSWLISLENHPLRKKKAQGFSSYAESLSTNSIDDLEDFLRLNTADIMAIIPAINIGIAKRLLAFAEEDAGDIRDHKRLHLL